MRKVFTAQNSRQPRITPGLRLAILLDLSSLDPRNHTAKKILKQQKVVLTQQVTL